MTTTQFEDYSPPITGQEDLLHCFKQGEKPRAEWKIGTEHEKFGFIAIDQSPLPYDGPISICRVFEHLQKNHGWAPIFEDNHVIALQRNQASITLEPGGQFELSGAPLNTAQETAQELSTHMQELQEISMSLGIDWLTVGKHPLLMADQLPHMPKQRYAIMRDYLPSRGRLALEMMHSTATLQTNFDYENEQDMGKKLQVALGLTPLFAAWLSNSPFLEGKSTGRVSERNWVWEEVDADRSGFPAALLAPHCGYQDYANYALKVPLFFIYRQGHYLPCNGLTFEQYLDNGFESHRATEQDWKLHLTTLFPHVRLKNYIELRMMDMVPLPMVASVAALTKGLFYDPQSLETAVQLVSSIPAQQLPILHQQAASIGLKARVNADATLQDWAIEVCQLAKTGLQRQHQLTQPQLIQPQGERLDSNPEMELLAPLHTIAESGITCADRLVSHWTDDWHQKVAPLFESEFVLSNPIAASQFAALSL